MSLLFDTAPEEPQRKKPRKRIAEPESPVSPAAPALPTAAAAPLGRLDGGPACLDQSCQAQCHDILEESMGRWFVECCFCGTGQWLPVIQGHLPPPAEGSDFVFRGGRFGGQAIGEVSKSSLGMDYIRWAAAEHPRPVVRRECETWLARQAEGGYPTQDDIQEGA